MRADIIGYFKACMTDIYLHIYARMADYIRTHPYTAVRVQREKVRGGVKIDLRFDLKMQFWAQRRDA